jgi:hypothetical protein
MIAMWVLLGVIAWIALAIRALVKREAGRG